ncbi:MAG: winged helix-turn-helix domain-containing protein [Acidobacteria bacterium]|nr:winged helix-turn-helix domain-containing protein [Acidobacteriota bacterium]
MQRPTRWTFASFEIDIGSDVLRRNGEPVRIGRQAFRALAVLVLRGGEIVTREELQKAIWGDRVHVDFERGLNECIRQARAALRDGTNGSRIIVTCPREGYRLGVPAEPLVEAPRRQVEPPAGRWVSLQRWQVTAAVLTIVAAGYLLARPGARDRQAPSDSLIPNVPSMASSKPDLQPMSAPPLNSASALFARPGSRSNVQAYAWYVRGRAYYDRSTGRKPYGALPYFERAVALDSSFTLAHAALASAYLDRFAAGIAPEESVLKARQAAQRAVDLDPTLAEAHVVFAELSYRLTGDNLNAEREFADAIRLDGRNAYVRQRYAMFLQGQQRFDDALDQLRIAQELDPLSVVSSWQKAHTLFLARRWEASMAEAGRTLELDPKHPQSFRTIGNCLEAMGKREEAIAAYRQAGRPAFGQLGRLYALMGRRSEARAIINELTQGEDAARNGVAVAYVQLGLGEPLAALHWLEKAHQAGHQLPFSLRVSPQWAALRASAAFGEFLKKNPVNGL